MGKTRATETLEAAGICFSVHTYETVSGEGSYGQGVAAVLGVEPSRLFKTLVAQVDGSPWIAIVPSDRRLSLRALAKAIGGKTAEMAEKARAEKLTGYVVGGISPFGQRRTMPVIADESLCMHQTVFVSGGRRGLQIELQPADLLEVTGARLGEIST